MGIEPAFPSPQTVFSKDVSESPYELAAVWQRKQGFNCRYLTLAGTEDSSDFEASIEYIRRAWPHLKPHIREAVFTLVDAGILQSDGALL